MIEAEVYPWDHHVFSRQIDECHLNVVKKNLKAAMILIVI